MKLDFTAFNNELIKTIIKAKIDVLIKKNQTQKLFKLIKDHYHGKEFQPYLKKIQKKINALKPETVDAFINKVGLSILKHCVTLDDLNNWILINPEGDSFLITKCDDLYQPRSNRALAHELYRDHFINSKEDNEEYLCPIGYIPITYPLVTPDGRTYQLENILFALQHHPVNPFTREPLSIDELRDNNGLMFYQLSKILTLIHLKSRQEALMKYHTPIPAYSILKDLEERYQEHAMVIKVLNKYCIFTLIQEFFSVFIPSVSYFVIKKISHFLVDYFLENASYIERYNAQALFEIPTLFAVYLTTIGLCVYHLIKFNDAYLPLKDYKKEQNTLFTQIEFVKKLGKNNKWMVLFQEERKRIEEALNSQNEPETALVKHFN